HVLDRSLAEDAGTEASTLAGYDEIERGFENTFKLKREEFIAAKVVELSRVTGALFLKKPLYRLAAFEIAHDQKIPRLRESHATRVMRGHQHPRQHFVRD